MHKESQLPVCLERILGGVCWEGSRIGLALSLIYIELRRALDFKDDGLRRALDLKDDGQEGKLQLHIQANT